MASKQRTKENPSRLLSLFTRYRFLMRLLTAGFFVLLIITLIATIIIPAKSQSQIREIAEEANRETAQKVSAVLDTYIELFDEVRSACLATPYTYEMYITNKIRINGLDTLNMGLLQAQELLHGYSLSMPIITGIGLYFNESKNVMFTNYSKDGKLQEGVLFHPCSVFCPLVVPELDSNTFVNMLSEIRAPAFYSDEALVKGGRMIFLLPVYHSAVAESRRVLIFDISKSSLNKALESVLANVYTVSGLSWNGIPIYCESIPEDAYSMTFDGIGQFSVTLSMPANLYQSLYSNYWRSIVRLGIIAVILCGVSIALFIFASYKPLSQIIRQISASRETDEITALNGYISKKEQVELDLRQELKYEKEISKIQKMEMLLLGMPTNDSSHPITIDLEGEYFVAVSPLDSFESVNDSIEMLKEKYGIISFESFRAGHLVMIGSVERVDYQHFVQIFGDLFGNTVSVGIGSICHEETMLHQSYLAAMADLRSHVIIPEGKKKVGSCELISEETINLFRDQLIANDKSCIQTAQLMFSLIDVKELTSLAFWHANYQLIEKISDMMREYGYSMNQASFLQFVCAKDIDAVRNTFLQTLTHLLETGPQNETANERKYGDSILAFINDNIGNELFSISDITDCFNLSESTVSRILHNKTGQSFKKCLTESRLTMAKDLLVKSNSSIQDIAQQCGFSSSSYFIRVFKSEVGITPLQYRNSAS